jgi:hypothetical protein
MMSDQCFYCRFGSGGFDKKTELPPIWQTLFHLLQQSSNIRIFDLQSGLQQIHKCISSVWAKP